MLQPEFVDFFCREGVPVAADRRRCSASGNMKSNFEVSKLLSWAYQVVSF